MGNKYNADKIIYGGAVYTAENKDAQTFAGGVAVKDDSILAVGSKEYLEQYKTGTTDILNCGEDSLIIPGINDGHMHIKYTIASLNGVPLRYVDSEEQCIINALKWEKDNSQYEWVFGFGWHYAHWGDKQPPKNTRLNKAFPCKPVCLVDTDFHAALLNNAALEKLGVLNNSYDIKGSVIVRNQDGSPTGYVQEKIVVEAADLAIDSMEVDSGAMKRNISRFTDECNAFGITSIADMSHSEERWLNLYATMSADQELTCRVSITESFWYEDFIERVVRLATRFPDCRDDVYFYGNKLFYDGVGMGYTSWQINPFHDRQDYCGEPVIPESELYQKTLAAIQSGFHVHIHACGDMSIRKAMDWWEEAINKGLTKSGQRFTITHNDTVDPQDIPRYAELGIVASMQPDMMAPTMKWSDNIYPSIFGPRLSQTSWPCRSIIDAGAVIALSSDSPVGLFDPMLNVYRSVTRQHADGKPEGGWVPKQKISLSNALWAYTYGSAYQLGKEDFLGTLEIGKKADIAVLDRNLFSIEPGCYIGTKSKLTLYNGNVVLNNL